MLKEDLIALLEDMPDGTDIRVAHQPSWPFEYSIDNGPTIAVLDEDNMPESDDLPEDFDGEDIACWYERQAIEAGEDKYIYKRPVAWLPEGSQLGHLPGAATRSLGWR